MKKLLVNGEIKVIGDKATFTPDNGLSEKDVNARAKWFYIVCVVCSIFWLSFITFCVMAAK